MDQFHKHEGVDTNSIKCNLREAQPSRRLELREAVQRVVLKWKWNPVPTTCRALWEKRPLTQPEIDSRRKPPKIRNIDADQFQDFQPEDKILNLGHLKEKHCPHGFQISISQDTVNFYKTTFDINNIPVIPQAIQINKELKDKPSPNSLSSPLLRWFRVVHNAKLTKFSMLENFPAYLANLAESQSPTILDDFWKRQLYIDPKFWDIFACCATPLSNATNVSSTVEASSGLSYLSSCFRKIAEGWRDIARGYFDGKRDVPPRIQPVLLGLVFWRKRRWCLRQGCCRFYVVSLKKNQFQSLFVQFQRCMWLVW